MSIAYAHGSRPFPLAPVAPDVTVPQPLTHLNEGLIPSPEIDAPQCRKCQGMGNTRSGNVCRHCGGMGAMYNRAQMAYHYLSAPSGMSGHSPIPGYDTGYQLPILANEDTTDPDWLADLLESARDDNGDLLNVYQLLIAFDYLTMWAETYEADAPYWGRACIRVMALVRDRLSAQMSERIPSTFKAVLQ